MKYFELLNTPWKGSGRKRDLKFEADKKKKISIPTKIRYTGGRTEIGLLQNASLLSITMFPCIFDPCRTRVSQSISLQPFSSAKKTSSFHFVEVLTKLILSCYRYPNIFVPIRLDTKTMVVQW